MSIDLDTQATLSGIPPSTGLMRGGTLGQGTVSEMVVRGLDYIAKGYVSVVVFYDGGMLDSAEIKKQAARPDFPKAV